MVFHSNEYRNGRMGCSTLVGYLVFCMSVVSYGVDFAIHPRFHDVAAHSSALSPVQPTPLKYGDLSYYSQSLGGNKQYTLCKGYFQSTSRCLTVTQFSSGAIDLQTDHRDQSLFPQSSLECLAQLDDAGQLDLLYSLPSCDSIYNYLSP